MERLDNKPDQIGSSSLDAVGFSDSDSENQCRRIKTYPTMDDFIPFPPFTKRKEDMEIKDAVKDHVLCFLPAKSLVRFRSVSKDWDHWIRSPFLAHKQSYSFRDLSGYFCQRDFDHTFVTLDSAAYGVPMPFLEFLPGPVDIRSSSNGLLLCQGCTGNHTYYVCNPVNKECMELPESMYYHGSDPALVLAFEPSVLNMGCDYLVICAVSLLDQPIVCFEIYSSKTMSWRRSAEICVELGDSNFVRDRFYMKGIAYWQTDAGKVLAFDLKHEVHGIIPLPCERPSRGILAKINDEIGYIGISNECCVQIYGGGDFSLKHRIDMTLELGSQSLNRFRVLPSVDDDEVVMVLGGSFIYSYRMSAQKWEMVSRVEGVDDLATARFLPYVNSLVSLSL